jgi:hypothetical protein
MSQVQTQDESQVIAWLNERPYGYQDGTQWWPTTRPRPPLYQDWLEQGRGIIDKQDALIALLAHQDTRVDLPMVALALGQIGDVRSCPILLKSLNSSDASLRREASNALGFLKCRDAVGSLCSLLLNDTDETVRGYAAVALGRIGGRQAESALESAISDQNNGVILNATWADSRAILQDPLRSDSDAFEAIELIRRFPVAIEKPQFWSDIADSGAYTDARRRWAVLQLFDRYLTPQSTIKDFGKLLGSPTWLKQDQIVYLEIPKSGNVARPFVAPGPHFPADLDPGDSLVGIRVCLPTTDDSMIYLRMGSRPAPQEIYAALMEKHPRQTTLKSRKSRHFSRMRKISEV